MMKHFVLGVILAAGIFLRPFSLQASEPLMVFAAASLTDALNEVAVEFKKEYKQEVDFNFGGSSMLRVQIENGASCDLFLAADKLNSEKLLAKKIIEPETSVNFLRNNLVVVGDLNNDENIDSLYDLSFGANDHVAIADPQAAPAGVYAMQVLKKAGLDRKFKDFIVPTLDVRAALALVVSGNAKYAIVYSSDAKVSSKVKMVYRVPMKLYDPIVYTAALIKGTENLNASKNFLSFLQTPQGKMIFEKYGFQSF